MPISSALATPINNSEVFDDLITELVLSIKIGGPAILLKL